MDDRTTRHLELMSIAPDHVVVTFRTPPGEEVRIEVSPVGEGPTAEVVSSGTSAALDPHHEYHHARIDGLEPDTTYRLSVDGAPRTWSRLRSGVRTLPRPQGRPVARIAMTNDVHLGEHHAGQIAQVQRYSAAAKLPGLRGMANGYATPAGHPNHARMMNEAAVRDIQGFDPDLVVVKGDLTHSGRPEQYAEFREVYGVFDDRLVAFRGNHDAYLHAPELPNRYFATAINGVSVAVLDTVVPGGAGGAVDRDQLDWLREYARASTQPVLVVGHHNLYMPRAGHGVGRTLFHGVNRDDTAALLDVIRSETTIVGYFAGHTHKNLRNPGPRGVPIVETASVKEFPGTWAAYEIFEDGYVQTLYQISAPEALAWSVRTKELFFGLAPVLNRGRHSDRAFTHHFGADPATGRDR